MPNASLALGNLRAVAILLILAFHCFSAYIVTQPAQPFAFDLPPYDWIAFPIIDNERWIGFDLFCAFQFLYLMQLMFFLSGLFVWRSLLRRGWRPFLVYRIVRLGVPFLVGVYALIPLAFYPVFRVTADDPSWSSFWSHWTALPITPTGPMWFLWFLIVLNVVAVILYGPLARVGRFIEPLLARAMAHAARFFVVVICISAATYLPLSAVYSPWKWAGIGPFEVQVALAPQYILYFLIGFVVGEYGYDRGLLDAAGPLVRRWKMWVAASLAAFSLWIIPTALIVKQPDGPIAVLQVIGDLGLVVFAAAACFSLTAIFLRFATARWPIIDTISQHSYGIYFFHYTLVLWLQFMLLGFAIPAIVKGLAVFFATAILSWAVSVVTNRTLANSRLLLGRIAVVLGAPSPAEGGSARAKSF